MASNVQVLFTILHNVKSNNVANKSNYHFQRFEKLNIKSISFIKFFFLNEISRAIRMSCMKLEL